MMLLHCEISEQQEGSEDCENFIFFLAKDQESEWHWKTNWSNFVQSLYCDPPPQDSSNRGWPFLPRSFLNVSTQLLVIDVWDCVKSSEQWNVITVTFSLVLHAYVFTVVEKIQLIVTLKIVIISGIYLPFLSISSRC